MKLLSCEQCGTTVNTSDKFCRGCGTLVNKKPENNIVCKTCKHENPAISLFCEKCGASINPEPTDKNTQQNDPKKIVSQGNYSGEMIKSKTSRSRKTIRNIIIAIVLIGIIAIIIWFQTDPDAGKKLGNILFGFVVMAIFALVIWRKSKKGKMKASKYRETNYDDDDWDDQDNDDFDDN